MLQIHLFRLHVAVYRLHVDKHVQSIVGRVLGGGAVARNAVIPGFDGIAFSNSIDISQSRERADAVIEALTKLLGKNGLVVDVG